MCSCDLHSNPSNPDLGTLRHTRLNQLGISTVAQYAISKNHQILVTKPQVVIAFDIRSSEILKYPPQLPKVAVSASPCSRSFSVSPSGSPVWSSLSPSADLQLSISRHAPFRCPFSFAFPLNSRANSFGYHPEPFVSPSSFIFNFLL